MITRKFVTQEVQRLCNSKVMEPAISEWASPVVVVPKKNDYLRMCIDSRKLNAVPVPDTYLPPRIDEFIDWSRDAEIFLTLDAN